jgi:hypothetical protein
MGKVTLLGFRAAIEKSSLGRGQVTVSPVNYTVAPVRFY